MKPVFRCSSLGTLMTNPKGGGFSVTAISELKQLIKEDIYGYQSQISSKYLDKGNMCESDSLALYNQVTGGNWTKNSERITKEFDHFILTGECDIHRVGYGITDLKTAWSLDTFPCFIEDALKKEYDWQLRGYMFLYSETSAEIAYCMVDTPDELCKYENQALHKVSHIPPELRVTLAQIERDIKTENDIVTRLNSLGAEFTRLRKSLLEEKGLA
jgi:hypothetical protein